MACNTLFGIGNGVTQRKADNDRKFTVTQAEIAVFDRIIHDLILDVETLHDIAKVEGQIILFQQIQQYWKYTILKQIQTQKALRSMPNATMPLLVSMLALLLGRDTRVNEVCKIDNVIQRHIPQHYLYLTQE